MESRLKKTGWGLMLFFSIGIVVFAGGKYLPFNPDHFFTQQREIYLTHSLGIYSHIVGGMIALLLGPFQFNRNFRNKHLNLHRWMGRIYLLGILIGGLGGLYMATLSYGGFVTDLGFGSLAICWLFTGGMAFHRIRHKQIQWHQEWMIRNFALTFAAVTLRLWLPIFIISLKGDFEPAYQAVSWFCWVPNLMIAEWIIQRQRSKIKTTSAAV